MSEAYYDEHIAPKLLAIAKECEANGLNLIATCGYAPDTYGTTRVIQEGAGFARFEEAIWRASFDALHAQHEQLLAWLEAHAPLQLAQFRRRDVAA